MTTNRPRRLHLAEGSVIVALITSLAACSSRPPGPSGPDVEDEPPEVGHPYDEGKALASLGLTKMDVEFLLASNALGVGAIQAVEAPPTESKIVTDGHACTTSSFHDVDQDGLPDYATVEFDQCSSGDLGYETTAQGAAFFYWTAASIPSDYYDLFFEAGYAPSAAVALRLQLAARHTHVATGLSYLQALDAVVLLYPSLNLAAMKIFSLSEDWRLEDGDDVLLYTEDELVFTLNGDTLPPVVRAKTQLLDRDLNELGRVYVMSDGADEGGRFWVSEPDPDPWDEQVAEPVAGGELTYEPNQGFSNPLYTKPDTFGSLSSDWGPDNAWGNAGIPIF